MMKSTLIKDLYGEIERLKAGEWCLLLVKQYNEISVVCEIYGGLLCFLFFTVIIYSEVYAAREKNGVYIPKERYHQEESEKKVLHYPLTFVFSQFYLYSYLHVHIFRVELHLWLKW